MLLFMRERRCPRRILDVSLRPSCSLITYGCRHQAVTTIYFYPPEPRVEKSLSIYSANILVANGPSRESKSFVFTLYEA